ncbi:hypothetical protein CPC08DRAFT_702602, partial [Agrocybe pediades]
MAVLFFLFVVSIWVFWVWVVGVGAVWFLGGLCGSGVWVGFLCCFFAGRKWCSRQRDFGG